jgi:hypothetical protein
LSQNIIIIADPAVQEQPVDARRRLQEDQTTIYDPVIYALFGSRHFVMSNASIITDGVIFRGSLTPYLSGGIVLETGFFTIQLSTIVILLAMAVRCSSRKIWWRNE